MVKEPKKLYSAKADLYVRFISAFLYPQGLQAFFTSVDWLRTNFRILDAGCGTGVVTFAVLKALHCHGYEFDYIHGFDLTFAMLERFRNRLEQQEIKKVELYQANVLELEQLPLDWTGYDLIVSAGMLEYIPKDKFPETLASLRSRLSAGGRFILFMTRQNWLTGLLIGRLWESNLYSRPELVKAFAQAGFSEVSLKKFPLNYGWLNLWGYIVEGLIS
ncbi:MAG: class I SAM-dependent methyltransferase [Acidobacteriota bacterium]